MQSSQRGSVLLAIIAGIVLLSVLGMVMVSLMTDSVMTGVAGKETVQASYLAESGKEIVRAQTAKLDGGALMEQALALEATSKEGLAVGTVGTVKLSLYPSWFRWNGEALKTTESGWYGNTPSRDREYLWLAVNKNGSRVYKGKLANNLFKTEQAADIYLVGRAGTAKYDSTMQTLTVIPAEGADDFASFPESGGLIGLVPQQTGETFPAATTLDTVRFTYDRKTVKGSTYTFTNLRNVTKLTDGTVSFENKNIALGQYFRVVSEGTTNNGARAALVWHTNGRNSLRFAGAGTGNTNVELDASGTLSPSGDKPDQELHKEMQDLFGNNITNSSQGKNSGYISSNGALMTQTLQPSVKNHFLLPLGKNKETTDYWFAAVSRAKTNFASEYGGIVQISIQPTSDMKELFAGTLFRVTTLKKEDSNGYSLGGGVAGLGMGIAYGEVTVTYTSPDAVVMASSINPALLPGFVWSPDKGFHTTADFLKKYANTSLIVPDNTKLYSRIVKVDWGASYRINPMMILWAYDDNEITNPPASLRWLAVSRLGSIPKAFSRVVTSVQEKGGSNMIRGWIEKNAVPSVVIDWPYTDFASTQPEKTPFTLLQWDFVNAPYASLSNEAMYGVKGPFTVQTPFATGTGAYERTGFFEGVYSSKSLAPSTANRPSFRNFAAGTLANTGDIGNTSGLTPGLIQ